MKGNKIMSTSSKNMTPADVAAQAAEEKLVTTSEVPSQNGENVKVVTEEQVTVKEGEKLVVKKTLKLRLTEAVEKVKENKQFLAGFALGAGAGALSYARYVAQKAAALTVTVGVIDEDNANQDAPEA